MTKFSVYFLLGNGYGFCSNPDSLLLSNWAPWNNRKKSILQRRFHGRRRCRIVRSLISMRTPQIWHKKNRENFTGYMLNQNKSLLKWKMACLGQPAKFIYSGLFLRDSNNRVNVFTLGCLPIATLKTFQTGISTYPCGNKSYLRITHF